MVKLWESILVQMEVFIEMEITNTRVLSIQDFLVLATPIHRKRSAWTTLITTGGPGWVTYPRQALVALPTVWTMGPQTYKLCTPCTNDPRAMSELVPITIHTFTMDTSGIGAVLPPLNRPLPPHPPHSSPRGRARGQLPPPRLVLSQRTSPIIVHRSTPGWGECNIPKVSKQSVWCGKISYIISCLSLPHFLSL